MNNIFKRTLLLAMLVVVAFTAVTCSAGLSNNWIPVYADDSAGEYWYYNTKAYRGWTNNDGGISATTSMLMELTKDKEMKSIAMDMELKEDSKGNIYGKFIHAKTTLLDGSVVNETPTKGFEYYDPRSINGYVAAIVLDEVKGKMGKKVSNGQDAGVYVNALISSTIFQEDDAFIKIAPRLAHGNANAANEYGKVVKEDFYQGLVTNTNKNYKQTTGYTVPNKVAVHVANGLVTALSKTQYDMLDVKKISSDTYEVRIAVRGLNLAPVSSKMLTELQKRYPNISTLSLKERLEKAAIVEGDLYKAMTTANLLPAKTVTIHVVYRGGYYYVPNPDEYVLPFGGR